MQRTRIKVCGVTQPDQASALVELGVDAIGMIIHASSPRCISLEQAKRIRDCVPAFVQLVGVTVDAELDVANQLASDIGLDLLQLHGDESTAYAQNLCVPYIKAIRAKSKQHVLEVAQQHSLARGILLDPYVIGQHGGTGQTLANDCWPTELKDRTLILAGGLAPDNVFQRVNELAPYAVDMNSGVERAPGDKDMVLVARAITAVQQADALQKDQRRLAK